jgi:hypothetical protein
MNVIKDFSIFYEGVDYDGGEMDIEAFAPSLLAFGQAIKIVNYALNGDKTSVQVSIKEQIENKCFKSNLSLYSKHLIDNLPLIVKTTEYINIEQILQLIGFIENSNILSGVVSGVVAAGITAIPNYISYKSWERGRKIESFVEYEDKSGYKIKIAGDEKFVSKNLGELIKKTQTDEKAKQLFPQIKKHLQPSGYTKYERGEKKQTITHEIKENLLNQNDDLNIYKATDFQESECNIKIRIPDLEGGRKWTFIWTGTAITPDYNENIEQQLKSWSGEKLKGCSVRVKLRTDFAIDNEGLKVSKTERYTILEILGDLQRPPEQTDLGL